MGFKSTWVKWSFVLWVLDLQVMIRFLVGVKFEEQDVVYEEVDPADADAPLE